MGVAIFADVDIASVDVLVVYPRHKLYYKWYVITHNSPSSSVCRLT